MGAPPVKVSTRQSALSGGARSERTLSLSRPGGILSSFPQVNGEKSGDEMTIYAKRQGVEQPYIYVRVIWEQKYRSLWHSRLLPSS